MARECKFLELNFDHYWQYEAELNKWINQGYEVKHIVSLDSLESHWAHYQGNRDDHICHELVGEGFLFYLEREVAKQAAFPGKTTGSSSLSKKYCKEPDDLPF